MECNLATLVDENGNTLLHRIIHGNAVDMDFVKLLIWLCPRLAGVENNEGRVPLEYIASLVPEEFAFSGASSSHAQK